MGIQFKVRYLYGYKIAGQHHLSKNICRPIVEKFATEYLPNAGYKLKCQNQN